MFGSVFRFFLEWGGGGSGERKARFGLVSLTALLEEGGKGSCAKRHSCGVSNRPRQVCLKLRACECERTAEESAWIAFLGFCILERRRSLRKL